MCLTEQTSERQSQSGKRQSSTLSTLRVSVARTRRGHGSLIYIYKISHMNGQMDDVRCGVEECAFEGLAEPRGGR